MEAALDSSTARRALSSRQEGEAYDASAEALAEFDSVVPVDDAATATNVKANVAQKVDAGAARDSWGARGRRRPGNRTAAVPGGIFSRPSS